MKVKGFNPLQVQTKQAYFGEGVVHIDSFNPLQVQTKL